MKFIFLIFLVFPAFSLKQMNVPSTLSNPATEANFNNDCCDSADSNPNLESINQTQCTLKMQEQVCQDVDSKYQKDCNNRGNTVINSIALIQGCLEGITDTTFALLRFLWNMMKGIFSLIFVEEVGENTVEEASAFMQSSANYLHVQYEQAYDESSPPGRMWKAASKMAGSIFSFIHNSTEQILQNYHEEYQCLNTQGQSEMLCGFVSSVMIPPMTLFAILKYGFRGAERMYPALKTARKEFSQQNARFQRPLLSRTGLNRSSSTGTRSASRNANERSFRAWWDRQRETVWKSGHFVRRMKTKLSKKSTLNKKRVVKDQVSGNLTQGVRNKTETLINEEILSDPALQNQ